MSAYKKAEWSVEKGLETSAGIVTLEPPIKEIIRKTSGEGRKEYYVYLKPESSEKRRIGFVSFRYENGGAYSYAELTKNLSNENTVVEIRTFYPSIYVSRQEGMELKRKGVGTAILDHFFEEWRSEGIAGVYCETTRRNMQRLLKKAGFQEIEKNAYFKML